MNRVYYAGSWRDVTKLEDYKKLVRETHNPKINAISRLAYKWAGGFKAYKKLPKEQRLKLREEAKSVVAATTPSTSAPARSKFTHPELDRIRKERKENYREADAKEARARDGFVYVIWHPDWDQVCKIGKSRDPDQRLRDANTWCPYNKFEMHCAIYSDDAVELESLVHQALKVRDREETGEWFVINRWHAENLIWKVKRDDQGNDSGPRSGRVPPCRNYDLAAIADGDL